MPSNKNIEVNNYYEYIAIQYVFNKLAGGMTASSIIGYGILLLENQLTICISLKTVKVIQLSIVESFFCTDMIKFLNK